MITEDDLAKEFVDVVERFYPGIGTMLHHCHVKVVTSYWGRLPKRLQHITIYCPEHIVPEMQAQKDALREVAKNMGLAEVVCRNAIPLLRDPRSSLKQSDPRFWLELLWMSTQKR